MAEISRRYKIPYRTLQHWKDGSRKPPEYVAEMLSKILKNLDK
jgi:DNA-binding transcriptional regulator YiaG